MIPALRILLLLAGVCLSVGLLAALRVHLRERRVVGEVIARELAGGRGRAAGVVLLLIAHLAAWVARDPIGPAWTLPVLGVALAFTALRPAPGDRVCGTAGVRRGWYVRRWAELEEWRLTGDHLRFRLRGQWEAVPLPAARQPQMAERLRDVIGERESPFK